jgi:hypothetical protein
MLNLITSLFFLMISLIANAQSFTYQLKGSYNLDALNKKPVSYTLRWSEEDGKILGEYSDDFYTDKTIIKGLKNENGRTFLVQFPRPIKNVKSIFILTSTESAKKLGSSLPVSIITRDSKGAPITSRDVKSRLTATALLAQKQEQEECQEGFGALVGYCGTYEGIISETVDRQNKCNLLVTEDVELTLKTDRRLIIDFGGSDSEASDQHLIGKLPLSPGRQNIDVMGRSCRPLKGIDSSKKHCKKLNLMGEFYTIAGTKHFKGQYTIFNEGNKNTCRYNLSLDQQ